MGPLKFFETAITFSALISIVVACDMEKKKEDGERKSYSFSSSSSIEIKSTSFGLRNETNDVSPESYAATTAAPPMCTE